MRKRQQIEVEKGEGIEPKFIEPMQCEPVIALPEDENWTFELKFDGHRCIAVKNGIAAELFSHNGKHLDQRFSREAKALAALPGEFTVDGEVVALDAQGKPSFQLLQNGGSRLRSIYFYAFDLLNRDGVDLIRSPIERRREMLDKLFAAPTDPLRLSFLFQATAEQILDAVKELGLEGVIGKRKGSIYEPGKRTGAPMRNHVYRLKCD